MRKLKNEELNRLTPDQYKASEKIPVMVILDNVRSLHNIGSVFRTADAFRIRSIFLCGITATPPHREIHKTALGATDSVPWEYHEHTSDVVALLRKEHYRIIAIEQAEGAVPLGQLKIMDEQPCAIVFGHEIRGVDQKVVDLSDLCVEIPQFGTKHSLNVSVAAGIVIWEVFKQYSLSL
ncbi:MAG: RNA methyltransferase [Bacteroidales bacterium]